MAPREKIPLIIECHSESNLREELERSRASLSLVEADDTWDTIGNALLRIIALSKGGACDFPDTLTSFIRSMYRSITSAAASERSRLSSTAAECIAALATGLGPSFDTLVPLFIPTLLSICSRPNKVFISRAKTTIQTIIDQTQLISLLPYFVGALREKSVTLRLIAIESLLSCVQCFNPPDLERDARARDVENAIRLTATDASADVRKVSRYVFDAYKILLPARVESFAAPLSPTMKKYLNIDITSGNSRPQSSQSTHVVPATRPISSLASAPSKWEDPYPRPATSMAHHRSASSSLVPTKASTAATSKLTRSEKERTIAPPIGHPAAGPSLKRRDNIPPAIVPQHRQQATSEPQTLMGRPVPTGRPEFKVAVRPQEARSSRMATQILRPDSTLPFVPAKQYAGPQRAEAVAAKERSGGPQRVLLPEAQSKPLLASQDIKVSAGFEVVFKRSRLDSLRHGPKSSAVMDAKRAVTQVSVATRLGPSQPPVVTVEKREVPIQATESKKEDSKPRFGAKNKGLNSKTSNNGVRGKKEPQMTCRSAPDRPKSSMSTRSISQGGTEAKTTRKELKGVPGEPSAAQKASQSANGGAQTQMHPPKKVAVRIGGATQPTLSQLARKKAADEEKERRAVAKGSTKPLTIRPKRKAVPPKVTSKVLELPAAAIVTPLPPSPEVKPADIPLPVSPVSVRDDQVPLSSTNEKETNEAATIDEHLPVLTPAQTHPVQTIGAVTVAKTPISALVSSIQRGFLLSPNSPLSPAEPDAEWECPVWPGLLLDVEGPSFEGVAESTVKHPPTALGKDPERKALVDMN